MTQMAEDVADQSWIPVAESRGATVNYVRYAELLEDTYTLLRVRQQLHQMLANQDLSTRFTLYDGLEQAPQYFVDFFSNSSATAKTAVGKKLLQVASAS